MSKSLQEWLKQANYDIKTTEIMFDNKRYFYAVCCEEYTFEEQGGVAQVRLQNGRIRRVELHWYEAHGIAGRI